MTAEYRPEFSGIKEFKYEPITVSDKDTVDAAKEPLLELLREFRAYQGEFEFSTDESERYMFDLLKKALLALGWEHDKPEDEADLRKRISESTNQPI